MSSSAKTTLLFAVALLVGAAGLALGLVPSPVASLPAPPSLPLTRLADPPVIPQPPPARGSDTLSLHAALSHPALLQGGSGETFLTIELAAKESAERARQPMNLALVLDRSGSMHGAKLKHAKQAARHVLSLLGPQDTLAVVAYGSDVELLAASNAVDARHRRLVEQAIDGLWDAGGTNLSGGLQAGVSAVERARAVGFQGVERVILVSDGQANEGVVGVGPLGALAARIGAGGVAISTIGVGVDFEEDAMQAIAERAAGRYHYLREASAMATIFEQEIAATAATVARAPTLRVELPSGVRVEELFGYPSRREGDALLVDLPDFPGGAKRKVVAKLHVDAGSLGARPVSSPSVSFADLRQDDRPYVTVTAPVVVAEVTDRREVVTARLDKGAAEQAVRAESGAALRTAAVLFGAGKRDEATRALGEAKERAKVANLAIGSTQVTKDNDELDRQIRNFSDLSVEGDSGRDAVKGAKSFANELSW